jgi:adenine-specific DNA-methyltransferase
LLSNCLDFWYHHIDLLGWDFAFEINEVAKQWGKEANITLHFKYIPRDLLDQKIKQLTNIQFFELAALKVHACLAEDRNHQNHGRTLVITLEDFTPPHETTPEDIRNAVQHWNQWIDYWAIDWNYTGIFHNTTQIYRTPKEINLRTSAEHTYKDKGSYIVAIKVIDLFGNDTTKQLIVEIK